MKNTEIHDLRSLLVSSFGQSQWRSVDVGMLDVFHQRWNHSVSKTRRDDESNSRSSLGWVVPMLQCIKILFCPVPHIEPEHCILTNSQNIVHLKPCSQTAMCYVNGKKVDFETNIELTSGSRVIFGKSHVFRFLNPEQARKKNPKTDSATSGGKSIDSTADQHLRSRQNQRTGIVPFKNWWKSKVWISSMKWKRSRSEPF